MDIKKAQDFVDVEEIMGKIVSISQKEAERLGVERCAFQGIKKRVRENGDGDLNTPAVWRLEIWEGCC